MPDTKRVYHRRRRLYWTTNRTELADREHEIALIEQDEARSEEVADEHVAMAPQGDATAPSTLEQADLERAGAIAASTDEPGANLAIVWRQSESRRTSEHSFEPVRGPRTGTTRLPTRRSYPRNAAQTRLPTSSRARYGPLLERTATSNPRRPRSPRTPLAGHTLEATSLPRGSLVTSDRNRTRIARADTELEPGEYQIVGVEPVLDEVLNLFRG
jgi:K+ transport systems, NAD-binding component